MDHEPTSSTAARAGTLHSSIGFVSPGCGLTTHKCVGCGVYGLASMPRREIVEGVIRKTVPLFGLVGAVKMGEQSEIPSQ
jgi:hypothetical protein